MNQTPANPPPSRAQLEQQLAVLQAERDALASQRTRNLLLLGIAISLVVHLCILWYLDSIRRGGLDRPATTGEFIEFAVLPEEDLDRLQNPELELDTADSLADLSEIPDVTATLDLETPPAADLAAVRDGAMPTLGGGASGGDGDMNLGATGAGVTFFDAEGHGTRFVFIIDVSGSMGERGKLLTAMRELARSLDSLPDFAYFHVLLFESSVHQPPWQSGWTRAKASDVNKMITWLDQVRPGGGTQPLSAFAQAFALDVPPDVIFFLTDGQIPADTPTRVRGMNQRGRAVVINTIAFGDPQGQDRLREIAENSGGAYRFVPVGGGSP
ncbi:MAG: vWA domain-containing protein [Phycisphaerales bacterium]